MSEFQYYEFVAIDRPLSALERKRLRETTSRATITSTRLVNTYEWGNFKADPRDLVAKCFDAFLYYANWGTHGSYCAFQARGLTRESPSNTSKFVASVPATVGASPPSPQPDGIS